MEDRDRERRRRDDAVKLVGSNHAITPRLRTIHTMTGVPVSGLNWRDYPLVALCLECGKRIRIANFIADWMHAED